MRDLLGELERLADSGPVGRAVVTAVWGSGPRPEGACMLGTPDGRFAGSVSGGCVEAAVLEEIVQAIERGSPRHLSFGVSDEQAWNVGLACGGTIKIFVEPAIRPELVAAARAPGGTVIATVLEGGDAVGRSVTFHEDGRIETPGDLAELTDQVHGPALDALRAEASRTLVLALPDGGAMSVFFEVFPRQPKLVIFGAVQIAAALVPLAKALGYRVIVADGRAAFLTRERFPDADDLILDWPEAAFAKIGIDRATYICILSHDPKFDEPALQIGLKSPARYIGAIGSRKTQAARRTQLRASGFTEADLDRVHGPIGLDLGGRSAAEIALSIMAEMTAVRYGREVDASR